MSAAPLRLAAAGIGKRYGATQALADVALALAPGEIHALVGENGAGKSTLMRVLAGVARPDEGTMELDGVHYAPEDALEARGRGVAMIHQELALAPHLSVAENVLLGSEPRRGLLLDRRALRARAGAALAAVGRAELGLERRVAELGPADRQMVEIARALAADARLLVLDEPTSSLTRPDVIALFGRLRALAARGVAVVYVSHVLEEVFALCSRFTVLRDGRSVASGDLAGSSPAALAAAMVGREVAALYPRSPPLEQESGPGEVVLRVERLAGRRLPRAATLELRRGEVLGLAGLVGAGRTELLRALFGLDPIRNGTVSLLALAGPRSPHERWRSGAGFLSEDRKGEGLALRSSLAENLLMPVLGRSARRGWLSTRALASEARRWIAELDVRCNHPEQAAGTLSGGNQQKVALARLFAADVDVLLLDEPTRGVDVGARAEIGRWIDALAHRRGKSVLVVSSHLPELLGLCDRVAVFFRGELGPARPVAECSEHGLMLAMTGQGRA